MVKEGQRYQELAHFLRTRRERLSPDRLGFGAIPMSERYRF